MKQHVTRKREQSTTLAMSNTSFEQTDFDRILTHFMITGMHPPSLLEDQSFSILLNGIKIFSNVSKTKY